MRNWHWAGPERNSDRTSYLGKTLKPTPSSETKQIYSSLPPCSKTAQLAALLAAIYLPRYCARQQIWLAQARSGNLPKYPGIGAFAQYGNQARDMDAGVIILPPRDPAELRHGSCQKKVKMSVQDEF